MRERVVLHHQAEVRARRRRGDAAADPVGVLEGPRARLAARVLVHREETGAGLVLDRDDVDPLGQIARVDPLKARTTRTGI